MMKKIALLLTLIVLFSSCEKLLFEENKASADPYVNFDYLWNQIDQKYSYFEFKNIDWTQTRDYYRTQIHEDMTEEQLFNVLGSMMDVLKDDHSNLISSFNISRYNLRIQHESNYSEHVVNRYYIPNFKTTGAFHHDLIDNGQVGYIRYESFMSEISSEQMDYLTQYYHNTKGLILDLRANGGGSIGNIFIILEAFCKEQKLAAYSINRDGPNHNDFGEKQPIYVLKGKGNIYEKPVMVLIDRYSYSATTFFSLITKAFDQIKLVGDTTGGGGGLPNGGQLPNGWNYRFSVSQLLDLQGNNYAEAGVPPDICVSFNWNNMTQDEIIDAAVSEIHKMAQKK